MAAQNQSVFTNTLPEKPIIVMTGDVVNSTILTQQQRINMLQTMEQALKDVRAICPDWEGSIFQGDSFQGYTLANRPKALAAALLIWANIRAGGFVVRIAIGIGNVTLSTGSSLTSDGEGFRQSGRLLQQLKEAQWLLGVGSSDTNFSHEWRVHGISATHLLQRCTKLQAEAMICQLNGLTQQQTALKLGIKQPAVHQRLQAAGWPVLEAMMHRFFDQQSETK